MSRLWYGSDEVRDFHPVVEKALNTALDQADLNSKYILKHHYGEFTSGIPDFALLDRRTKDFICIIEVKKTPADVLSKRYGLQTKGYVDELFPLRWKVGFHPYFCVTNIELTQFYCFREGSSLIGCLLVDSPHDSGFLDDDNLLDNFIDLFKEFFINLDELKTPEFSSHLEAISESFNETFFNIADVLDVNFHRMHRIVGKELKESILYELLRFAFYYYIKEYYSSENNDYIEYFNDFNVSGISDIELLNLIEQNFTKAMEIDFNDILKDYDSPTAIIPEKIRSNEELAVVFNNFILTLRGNAPDGIRRNKNLLNFVSLLTSEIYDREEMHSKGKIMSDEILSELLAYFSITPLTEIIMDPCCGDGNLLLSSYNRLKSLHPELEHNEILDTIYGIEEDPNLIQLAAFKLICNNLSDVNEDTTTNFYNMDLFDNVDVNMCDAIVMNPPFLRNEDLESDLKRKYLNNLESISNEQSFIRNASQPNKYFYFIEKAVHLLKDSGKASIIVMTKFLNNKDGKYLKEFLKPYLNSVITYPPNFFEGFRVTTCILLISKEDTDNEIAFLNISNTDELSNLGNVELILNSQEDLINENYSLVKVSREDLNPEDNWKLFLIDPNNKLGMFEDLNFLNELETHFGTIKRGKAGNLGGSAIVYPFSGNNPLNSEVDRIESEFIGRGMLVNKISKGRRKFILTENCLNASPGLIVPGKYNKNSSNGLSDEYNSNEGLNNYFSKASTQTGRNGKLIKWDKIVNEVYDSELKPLILLPRGDRKKHSVYYNPLRDEDILISTNFFYLMDFRNYNTQIDIELQIKFITAFLISSFGQIQFETLANNQEGSRKMEGFMVKKLKVPNLNEISEDEFDSVVKEFEELNSNDVNVSGLESFDENPRHNLDMAFGKVIFQRDDMGFENEKSMVKFFQEFLSELVSDRVKK